MPAKNWTDRADRDLFFTILSCKNIGIITGAEWTAIGNNMRTLGYGFTNEGCRQHFQGLRRTITGKKRVYAVAAGEAHVSPVPGQRAASMATFGVDALFGAPGPSLPHGVDPRCNPIAWRRARSRNGGSGSNGNVLYGVCGVHANGANDINIIDISKDKEPCAAPAAANGSRPLLSGGSITNSVATEENRRAESTPNRRRDNKLPQMNPEPPQQASVSLSAAYPAVPASCGNGGVHDDEDTDVEEAGGDDDDHDQQQNKRQRLYETFPVLANLAAVPLRHPPMYRPHDGVDGIDKGNEVGNDTTDAASSHK